MTKLTVQKGDTVTILTGKDSGKTGLIEAVLPRQNKVVVTGFNIVKKHIKKSPRHPTGGITTVAKPLDRSNVMVICAHCKKPARIAFSSTADGRYRICKRCKTPFTRAKAVK